jgi:hypothetical protein
VKRRRDKARHVSQAGLGGTREEIEQTRLSINASVSMKTDDGVWSIYFNTVLIATLNERDYIIRG